MIKTLKASSLKDYQLHFYAITSYSNKKGIYPENIPHRKHYKTFVSLFKLNNHLMKALVADKE